MIRLSLLVCLISVIPVLTSPAGADDKCGPAPTIRLSSATGSVCGLTTVTLNGNTFGGSASMVMITDNGKGSVSPAYSTSSPFSFTYTPKSEDLGNKVSITIVTNDPPGKKCRAARITYTLTVNAIPPAPGISSVVQPTCSRLNGSAVLKDLPDDGKWTLTRSPDGETYSGSGSSTTVSNLQTGRYNFSVTSAEGCVSALSGNVIIQPAPFVPTVKVTDPAPVCFPLTIDLTSSSIIAGSSTGLTYSYWKNSSATQSYDSPLKATGGTYYIKGTAVSGCYDIKPVKITVIDKPAVYAGSDKVLEFLFRTNLEARSPGRNETGTWSVISGTGSFSDKSNPSTIVSDLSIGKNHFLWTINNGICQPSFDTVTITVLDLVVPTLITANMDGRNDFLVIPENETTGKTELIIFNRRGIEVYRNINYKNDWNGLDSKGDPLPQDTYFYIMKFGNGRSTSGYIVIRR